MIEIKGNTGKSRIFEELVTSDTLGIIIDDSFRHVYGDKIFIVDPYDFNFDWSDVFDFIETFPLFECRKIMVYTNFTQEQVAPLVEWMKKKEENNSYVQCVVFYKG